MIIGISINIFNIIQCNEDDKEVWMMLQIRMACHMMLMQCNIGHKKCFCKVGIPVPPGILKISSQTPGGEVLRISSDGDDRISGSKNQDPKKSLGLPTKPNGIPGPKINSK